MLGEPVLTSVVGVMIDGAVDGVTGRPLLGFCGVNVSPGNEVFPGIWLMAGALRSVSAPAKAIVEVRFIFKR